MIKLYVIGLSILNQALKSYLKYYRDCCRLYFCKKICNKAKIDKLEKNCKIRFKQFNEYKKDFIGLIAFVPKCRHWLNSKEFKQKYLNTKHPYPPLFNPNDMECKNINANLAYYLNLPLPQNYEFIYITNGSSASAAANRWFKELGFLHATAQYRAKPTYIINYDFLYSRVNKNYILAFANEITIDSDAPLLINSLSKKVPLFYIARDPIGRIKHALNHIEDVDTITSVMKRFNLTCNVEKLFPKLTYLGGGNKPSFIFLQQFQKNYNYLYTKLITDTIFKNLQDKISSIYCVEFDDLSKDKAFDTYCKFADKFGFERPQNKEVFSNYLNPNTNALSILPVTLYVHPDDLDKTNECLSTLKKNGGFNITITYFRLITNDELEKNIDINEDFGGIIINDTRIFALIPKDEFSNFKSNEKLYEATQKFLRCYFDTFKNQVNTAQQNAISEKQIIEFLRSNKECRRFIKDLLDSELNYIKTHHPKFIQKWKYYLEFESLCKELDR